LGALDLDLDPLLAAVRARSSGLDSRLHGERHWQCVAHAGADLCREVSGADRTVVFLFGLLHDSRRENDGYDPEHGPRAAAFAHALHAEGLLPLDEAQRAQLELACELHTDGQVASDATVAVCWDADRLNLWRVGITPKPELLSTPPARRREWIEGAPALARQGYEWSALLEAAAGPPTGESFWIEAGRLAAGKYPGAYSPDEARRSLATIAATGVTAFFDLTEDGELEPYAPYLPPGTRHARFATRDFTHPPAERMTLILDAIDAEIDAGGTVYLHCWGGCGRSGSVAGSWLVRHDVPAATALARFAALSRPVSLRECPETEAQRTFVRSWRPGS
jgi:uncharacterized protein